MKIGIIGMGHVGTTMQDLLRGHAELVTYDVADDVEYPHERLAECAFATVCVGTPSDADGYCDVSAVHEAVKRLPVDRVLLKSTVSPGTTDELIAQTGKQICMSPEYVGESAYQDPAWSGAGGPEFVIFGGEPQTRAWFIDAFTPMLGPAKTYFQCTALEAELIKYMENSYLATKVTFVNEFRRICEAFGAGWHTVREGWLLDPRIGRSHTAAFVDEPGFGGRCLPKDTAAIVAAARQVGCSAELLAGVLAVNEKLRGGGVAGD